MPYYRRLNAGFSTRRFGFSPGPLQVGFIVNEVVLEQVLLRVSSVFPANHLSTIVPYLLLLYPGAFDSPDHAEL
jgi:hypothetical protein